MYDSKMVHSIEDDYDYFIMQPRYLEGDSMAPTISPTIELVVSTNNDAQIIRDTLRVYGSLYLLFFLTFCIVRKRYPKLYNIRSWVPEMKSELAATQNYGFISWAWQVFRVDDDELLKNIGMDGLCFLRCLRLGAKLSFVGVLNSIWLIPMFLTAETSPETEYLTDRFALMSIANLPPGSPRFAGVVVAAYVVLFFTLYLINKEYSWFIEYRHKFMSQRIPRNYAIYVSGIPEHLRSDYALTDFFRNSSWNSAVVEAHMAMDIPSLEADVARRNIVIEKLEHALAKEKIKGIVATHRTFQLENATKLGKVTKKVDSVEVYEQELRQLNNDISLGIGKISNQNHRLRHHLKKGPPRDSKIDSKTLRLELLQADLPLSPIGFDAMQEHSFQALPPQGDSGLSPIVELNSPTKLSSATEDIRQPAKDDPEIEVGPGMIETEPLMRDEDLQQHPFVQLIGMQNFFDGSQQSDASTISEFTRQGWHDPSNLLKEDGKADEEMGEGDVEKGKDDQEGDGNSANVPHSSSFQANAVDQKSIPKENTLSDWNQTIGCSNDDNSSYSVESKESQKSSRSKPWKQCSSASAKKLATSLRKSVNVEHMSGGVKKVGAFGVHGAKRAADFGVHGAKKAADLGVHGAKKAAQYGVHKLTQAPELAAQIADTAAFIAPMLRRQDDGTPRDAGFVVFRDLYTTQAARQMLQHPSVNTMNIEAAPSPDEVFWRNVGLPGKAQNTGRLLSMAATITLCFFWSIPMAFLSSLTQVSTLKEKLPRLGELIETLPWLESFLAVLAPLLLLALNEGVLPNILKWFATWEGLVGSPQLEASTFVKLSSFVIIQQFFVSAVSGSISAELANILANPEAIIDILANSLPAQASYFIQIVLVFTFMLQGLELLRFLPLLKALLRRYVGPNLTAKERKRTWRFAEPLEDPVEFFHAEVFAQIVLFYVVFFVYSSISPVTCIFLLGSFLICESGYRYHFIHNHKTTPDSGGKLWKGFIRVLMASMLIGQLTLIGVLALKKAVYAVPALTPMLGITILYMALVSPKKIHVSNFLPTVSCVELDRQFSHDDTSNIDFLARQYVQPELQHRRLFPDREIS